MMRRLARRLAGLFALAGALATAACGDGPPAPVATAQQVAALERRSTTVDGVRLSWLRAGDPAGRRIIFVHGTPGDAEAWADYLINPPAGFEVIAIDRPGFGQSGPDGPVVSLAGQATALKPLLVERAGRRPILVGHSLGGPIIAQAAADMPDHVGPLVIVAGSLDPGLEKIHWAQHVGAWRPVEALLPRALRNANAELMALEPQLAALAPRLAGITCPVAIVHGTKDGLVPYANVPFMQQRMTGAARMEVMTLADRNHFLPWNSMDDVRAAIDWAARAGAC
jgi:pimeloyl-ACP methyl ester carboxylesterase